MRYEQKDRPLTEPHYSSPLYKNGRTQNLFGEETDDLTYQYSDTLQFQNYEKWQQGQEQAKAQNLERNSVLYFECVLSSVLGRPIEIGCVLGGVNVGNWFPYWIFGYKTAKEASNASNKQ